MNILDSIFDKARRDKRRVVLPESDDDRVLQAAFRIHQLGIADVILVGEENAVHERLDRLGIETSFPIVSPTTGPWVEPFARTYYELRKSKGVTLDVAREAVQHPITHGIMMLHENKADGLVAGANHSTADTLRPALQIVRTAPGVSLVSSFFLMVLGETSYLFADCGLVEDPNAEQLAEIALSTAQTAMAFGIPPTVALLSYSTKGSADSPLTRKVVEATRIAQSRMAERFGSASTVRIDGELQVDAALIEAVAAKKAKGSPVAGSARVLIFPDLNSGNIAYKLVERLAGAKAYGPIVQGLRLPANDLSRGCAVDDIVGVAAITVVQSQLAAPSGLVDRSVS